MRVDTSILFDGYTLGYDFTYARYGDLNNYSLKK